MPNWLEGCAWLPAEVRNHLVHCEVLRRCEGVGRLLLRHRGEPIAMVSPVSANKNNTGKLIYHGSIHPWLKSVLLTMLECND